ncbi:MAG: nucleoside hydrolase [Planctomycetales bacterium]|nr:nucleoside hydrolase [Planctomycetales bacterium]
MIVCYLMLAAQAEAEPPVKIIFDTDMASDCDDVGALAVLHALADLGEAEILAVVTNRKGLAGASAAAVSAINHWYGRPDIPIGTDKDGAKIVAKRSSSFTPALRDDFPHTAKPDDQMPDALQIYRQSLAAQPDHSVVVCSVGALSNLEDLLRSPPDSISPLSGMELVEAKVQSAVIMGGGFPRTRVPETNIMLDPAAAVTVVNQWPTVITWTGFEVGYVLLCGGDLKSAPAGNPVRRAFELRPYHDGFSIDQGKPAYDQTAVLLAIRGPQQELFGISGRGRVVVDSDGHTQWIADNRKSHQYVHIKGNPRVLARVIEDLMIAPPRLAENR